MAQHLTDKIAREIAPPASGNRIHYDADVKGFGLRITSSGARAWVLNYRAKGIERRITIGSFPDWSAKAAREKAASLKRDIDDGADPMADRHAQRAAPTINDLADRFEAEHLTRRRATTARDYQSMLRLYIRPMLGKLKVADVRHADIEKLHRTISETAPYRANRTVAVLSKMMSLAIKWEMRADNPAKGIEKAPEEKRERYLTPAEIGRLGEALAAHRERASANAIRFLLLTGARRGETLAAKWSDIDLEAGIWTKPAATTKSKKMHRVPLSAPARTLLAELAERAQAARRRGDPAEYVFEGIDGKPLTDLKKTWRTACEAAGIEGVRVHDLRHSFASILASAGLSLPIIGQLLGHTQTATTARYAHLLDDPLRLATERAGAVISGAGTAGAEVVEMQRGKRA